jgi:hypothetical protein
MANPEASIIHFLFPESSLQLLPLGPESLVANLSTLLAIDQRLASLPGFDHEDRRIPPDAEEILFGATLLEYSSSNDSHEEAIFLLRDWWKRRVAQERKKIEEKEPACSCCEDSTEEETTEEELTEEQPSEVPTSLKVCNFRILKVLYMHVADVMTCFPQEIRDKAIEKGFTQLKDDCDHAMRRILEMYNKIKEVLKIKIHAPSDSPPIKTCLECFESLEQTNAYQSRLFKGFKEEDMNLVIAGEMILKWLEVVAETLTTEVKDKVIGDITSILKTAFKCTA